LFLNSRKKLGIFFVGGFSLLAGLILIVTATIGAKPARANDIPTPAQPTPMSEITLASLGAGTVVVDQTNSSSTYTLKAGYIYKFEVWGAQGGNGGNNGGTGGRGSYAMGWYDMRDQSVQGVTWFAGRQGGQQTTIGVSNLSNGLAKYNGAAGGFGPVPKQGHGGAGGGASGILLNTTEIIIAGAGAGGGGAVGGGNGGGRTGGNGSASSGAPSGYGIGATQTAHGNGATYDKGGDGSIAGNSSGAGGGGGGGYTRGFSGGGGHFVLVDMKQSLYHEVEGGGGAGGTSYIGGVTSISGSSATTTWEQRTGHGRVVITEYKIEYTVALPPESGTGWVLVG